MHKIKITKWHILFFGLSLLGWLLFGLFCDLEAQELFKPKTIYNDPLFGRQKIAAKIDVSTIFHFAGGFLTSFISRQLSVGLTIGMEMSDASGYGFDLGDTGAGLAGMYLHKRLSMPQLLKKKPIQKRTPAVPMSCIYKSKSGKYYLVTADMKVMELTKDQGKKIERLR